MAFKIISNSQVFPDLSKPCYRNLTGLKYHRQAKREKQKLLRSNKPNQEVS